MTRYLQLFVLMAGSLTASLAVAHDEKEHASPVASAAKASTPTPAADTPAAAVAALHAAMSAGDAKQVEALLDPQVLILEGGNAERSREEYASHHLGADLAMMKSVTQTLLHQSSDTVGDLAWVASESRLVGNRDGKEINLMMTETLVLKRGKEGWKVTHIHWSSRPGKKT